MSDHNSISMATPMVRAMLEGIKTNTRRLAYADDGEPTKWMKLHQRFEDAKARGDTDYCELLWVKEQCAAMRMPIWASRLTLEVTATRLERLQDISREDAIAEGLASQENDKFWRWQRPYHDRQWRSPIAAFQWLWDELLGHGSWEKNPLVVALIFRVQKTNILKTEEAREAV